MYARMNVCMYVCMYACMHTRHHVCMYVRMQRIVEWSQHPFSVPRTLQRQTTRNRQPSSPNLKSYAPEGLAYSVANGVVGWPYTGHWILQLMTPKERTSSKALSAGLGPWAVKSGPFPSASQPIGAGLGRGRL